MEGNAGSRNKAVGVLLGLAALGVSAWGQVDWSGSSNLFRVVKAETISYHQLEVGAFAEFAGEFQDCYGYFNFGLVERFELGVAQKWLGDKSKIKPEGGDRQSIGNTVIHSKVHFHDETSNIPAFALGMTVIVPSGEEEQYNDLGLTMLGVAEKHFGNLGIYGNLSYTNHNIDALGYHVGVTYELNPIFSLVEEINGLHTNVKGGENNSLYVTVGVMISPTERFLIRGAAGAKLLEDDENCFRGSFGVSWRFF